MKIKGEVRIYIGDLLYFEGTDVQVEPKPTYLKIRRSDLKQVTIYDPRNAKELNRGKEEVRQGSQSRLSSEERPAPEGSE